MSDDIKKAQRWLDQNRAQLMTKDILQLQTRLRAAEARIQAVEAKIAEWRTDPQYREHGWVYADELARVLHLQDGGTE